MRSRCRVSVRGVVASKSFSKAQHQEELKLLQQAQVCFSVRPLPTAVEQPLKSTYLEDLATYAGAFPESTSLWMAQQSVKMALGARGFGSEALQLAESLSPQVTAEIHRATAVVQPSGSSTANGVDRLEKVPAHTTVDYTPQ